ncbi:MAG: phosphatidylglycerophosphatase A [Cellvibrionaceae bacterium]
MPSDFMTLIRHPLHFLALGFGSGLAPKAPGTFGTLAAVPLYLLIGQLPATGQILVVILSFLAGIYLCQRTAEDFGVHDHPAIVWDEFVGYWATMLVLPLVGVNMSVQWLLLGFILFRLFDILKPWPIAWVDSKVSGGLGIMLDDLLAALYAGLLLWLAITVSQGNIGW